MINNKAIEIYKLILKEINGFSQEEIDNLNFNEIVCDPIYEKIYEIIGDSK